MKRLALLILVVGLSIPTFAQKQKLAHVNTQQIINDLAVKDSVEFKLKKLAAEYQAQFAKHEQDLNADINEFMLKKDSMSATIRQMEQERLSRERQELEQVIAPRLQQGLQAEEQKLSLPIQEKVLAAIEKIAKAKGYTYVIEEASALYAGGTDITALVRTELGLPAKSATSGN